VSENFNKMARTPLYTLPLRGLRILRDNTLLGEFVRGALGAGAIKIASLGLSLVLSVFLARLLGPAEFGIYSFIFALVSILAIPAQMGLPNLVVRETARSQVAQDFARIKGMWRWAGGMALLSCVILAMLGGGASLLLGGTIPGLGTATFYWGLALMPLIALGALRGAALRGLGVISTGLLPEFLLLPGIFILLLIMGVFIFNLTIDASNAMMLHVAAAAVAFLVGAWLLHRAQPVGMHGVTQAIYDSAAWRKSALPLAFIAGAGMITRYTDIVMLGLMRSEAEVGVYRIAAQWANLVSFGLMVINFVVPPHFARLHATGDKQRLQQLTTKTALVSTFLSLPPFLAFLVFGENILTFLVGAEYTSSYLPLVILAVGQMVNATTGSVAMILAMTGFERDSAKVMTISVALNIALNLTLIPFFGTVGAATATTITLSMQVLVLWVVLYKRLALNSSPIGMLNFKEPHT
jgi:O-antigen/teichoic acid export membrane protein